MLKKAWKATSIMITMKACCIHMHVNHAIRMIPSCGSPESGRILIC